MPTNKANTLLLIDSHALIHRAYHAFPPDLRTKDGEVVNAVYGFARLLIEVLLKFKPSHVVALFDSPGKTVRHDTFIGYKANRKAPDDELIQQIPRVEEMLAKFSIPCLKVAGYEADDLIGTIDARHSGAWARTIIVTGDRDLFQLVDADTFVYLAGSQFSASQLFDSNAVKTKMGVGPEYIVDLKALHGDPSDNIPGVPGIGEKGAVELITQFGHVEEVIKNIGQLPTRYQKRLLDGGELAEMSKNLATIIKDAPVSFDFESQANFGDYKLEELRDFFAQMQFRSLQTKLDDLSAYYHPATQLELPAVQPTQVNFLPLPDRFSDEVVFWSAEIQKPADPLTWNVSDIYISQGGLNYKLSAHDLASRWKEIAELELVGVGCKDLLHVLANLGLDTTKVRVFDLGLSTYIITMGQSKQSAGDVAEWYGAGGLPIVNMLTLWQKVWSEQNSQLQKDTQLKKVNDTEQSLLKVVCQMERAGIGLDVKKLANFSQAISAEIQKTEQSIYATVGHEFNISSPKQVGEVLFGEKGLPAGKKTKTGSFATDERTLRNLVGADPVVEQILTYRELTKLLSTYLSPLPTSVNNSTGRIHGTFNQIGAVTGRFSSINPNMQNLPLGEVAGVNVREAFVAKQGATLVSFDYSQQELRLLAELSKDVNMLAAFRSGEDIHRRTAAEMFDVPLDKVTPEQRKVGKTVNFGIIYGMSGFGLADRLKIGNQRANEYVKLYFERYPKVREYYDKLLKDAREKGYVESILGRRRDTSGLGSSNYMLRQATEREVMNYPLQASAADIIKLGMLRVAKFMHEFPVKMVLQIHDELIFEYDLDLDSAKKDPAFNEFVTKARHSMLAVVNLNVPLEVGVEIGRDLADTAEFVPLST